MLADEADEVGVTERRVRQRRRGRRRGASWSSCSAATARSCAPPSSPADAGVPLLGVNLGRVGFLAEAESSDLDGTVDHVLAGDYAVEERLTARRRPPRSRATLLGTGWALNEASVEKAARERMLEVVVEVDGRPLSRWGCDGVVAATPDRLHGLRLQRRRPGGLADGRGAARRPDQRARAVRPADGRGAHVGDRDGGAAERRRRGARLRRPPDHRRCRTAPGSRSAAAARRCRSPGRRTRAPFTDTLVEKFDLPVDGWRGRPDRHLSRPQPPGV